MRFGAHQTFHLRDNWLIKGIHAVQSDPMIFESEAATTTLGVGKNMVDSIEYWLKALKLIEKKKNGYELTNFGELVFTNDFYFEYDGTLILCHYLLATNKEEATTWYWFFNKFAANEFEVDSMKIYLQNFVQTQLDKNINANTLDKDILCLLRMYKETQYDAKENPETENPSPFSKFSIVSEFDKKLKKQKIKTDDIHPLVFVYLVYLFWKDELNSPKSVQLEEIMNKELSPGVVLGLSMDDGLSLIEKIEKEYGNKYVQFSRTGGYMILNVNEKEAKKAMSDYYKTVKVRM
jgi:hypothetical protein